MKGRKEGSAMILVMCMMAVTAVLCMALLLSASMMMKQAVRSGQREQCRLNAVSVSDLFIKEITSFQYGNTLENDSHGQPDHNLKDRLQTIVSPGQLENPWYAYNPDVGVSELSVPEDQVFLTYQLISGTLPGSTEVCMYWVDENDNQDNQYETDPALAAVRREDRVLYLKVTGMVGSESCTIISRFAPQIELTPLPGEDGCRHWEKWSWSYQGHEWERSSS